jgi:hypothetical protein
MGYQEPLHKENQWINKYNRQSLGAADVRTYIIYTIFTQKNKKKKRHNNTIIS